MRGWFLLATLWLALAQTPVRGDAPPVGAPPAAGTFEIHVIDVGSGLAVFVEGHDFAILYDAGSNNDSRPGPDNRVIAYLRSIRPDLRTLDHVIVSHPYLDHISYLPDILAQYSVGNIWNSGSSNTTCGYRALLHAIAAEPGVTYHDAGAASSVYDVAFPNPVVCRGRSWAAETISLRRGSPITRQSIILGKGARMTILQGSASTDTISVDDSGVVVRLDLGSRSILLPGDIGAGRRAVPSEPPRPASGEARLLACCKLQLKADILVVAHHGSMSASSQWFLDAVGAKYQIISVGPKAYAGIILPDLDVVAELEQKGSVFRTDFNDVLCAKNEAKIGPDADGLPGGCDNVRITIDAAGAVSADYNRHAD